MVLKFRFTYKSNDKTLAKFLDYASKQFECSSKILQENDFVDLYINSSEEVLNQFSQALSLYIPMSIYYYDVQIEVVKDKFTSFKIHHISEEGLLCDDLETFIKWEEFSR